MRFLSKRIESALVVDPEKQDMETIKFGATVSIVDEEAHEMVYQIVGTDEFDTKLGRISWSSPIASSLIGKSVGDEVSVKTPSGLRAFEIVKLEYKKIHIKEFEGVSEGQC